MSVRPLARAHWLAGANAAAAAFVALPFLAPTLLLLGQAEAANLLYAAYRNVCHQWSFRSYFLFGARPTYGLEELGQLVGPAHAYTFVGSSELGYKVAFCERDVAIYLAVLVGGLCYALLRSRIEGLAPVHYLALIAPMAVDGFTQLFGWRESSVEFRTVTGLLFGLASVWLLYPRVDRALRIAAAEQPRASARPISGAAAPAPSGAGDSWA